MSRFVHIALAALVAAVCAAAQARTVRSIPEAKTLTHADFVSPVDFELRGKLLFAATEYRVPSDRSIVIEQNGHRNEVLIENGTVRMQYSDCANQICVHEGAVSMTNRSILRETRIS